MNSDPPNPLFLGRNTEDGKTYCQGNEGVTEQEAYYSHGVAPEFNPKENL